MTTVKLTSKEVRDIAPTYCAMAEEAGEFVFGGLQLDYTEEGFYPPSGYDIEREAQAKFGAVKISEFGPDDDDKTLTYIVVRA